MSWRENLAINTPAYDFVCSQEPVIRSVAGPGTGKSFAIKRRIAKLLSEGADPKRILAVTFTRTAAADLKRDIESLDIEGADKVVAKTLHSLCFQILARQEILETTGRYPRMMLQHEIKPMIRDLNNELYGDVRKKETRVKAYEAAWARLQHDEPGYAQERVDALFERDLINWLKFHKAMLIGEIIPVTLSYLQDNPGCRERNMFDHILVDEFQDLNKAEQELIYLLKGNGSIVIVGDDDQSIYSFKHAHPEGIREIPNLFSSCQTITFNECRRCPISVVEMASNLISNNTDRTLGDLVPKEGNENGNVSIIQWNSLEEEITGIADIIQYYIDERIVEPKDILLLTPRRYVGYKIRDSLNQRQISAKSYFREEALDSDKTRRAFSLLNLAAISTDEVALRYLLGVGGSDFRCNAYNKLLAKAHELGCSIIDLLNRIVGGSEHLSGVSTLVQKYNKIKQEISEIKHISTSAPDNLINFLAPGNDADFKEFRDILFSAVETANDRMSENEEQSWLKKVYDETFNKISFPDAPSEVNHLRIMSLHASKGLSAKFVIVTECVEELIPKIDRDLSEAEANIAVEEQRRLFYVAITRCKCELGFPGYLIMSSCTTMSGCEALKMNIPAKPTQVRQLRASRFLHDLGPRRPRPELGLSYLSNLR